MKFIAEVKYQLIEPVRVCRLFLCLRSEDGTAKYEVMQGLGAYNHIMTEKLVGVDWNSAQEKASSDVGTPQVIQTIELDEDDLNHLTRYRVDSPETVGCLKSRSWNLGDHEL
jgi:hypothetical protein